MAENLLIEIMELIQTYCKERTFCVNCIFWGDDGCEIGRCPEEWEIKKIEERIKCINGR